jgi:hypothetical protein
MQTGFSETLIGWKSGKPTYVPLWARMEGVVAMDSGQRSPNFQLSRPIDYLAHTLCDSRNPLPLAPVSQLLFTEPF